MIIPIHLHAKGQESNIMFDYSLLLQPRLAYEYHTCRALIPGMIFKKEREHFFMLYNRPILSASEIHMIMLIYDLMDT